MSNYLLCSVDLTNRCNLACPYCYKETVYFETDGSRNDYFDLEAKRLKLLFDWLLTSSKKTEICFQFHGGEPLIKWDRIVHLVDYARTITSTKSISFGIQTNGTLLTPQRIQYMKDNNLVLGISFDGTKKQQDANRPGLNGKGSYERIKQNIPLLLENFPNTVCQVTVTEPETMIESLENLVSLGFRNTVFLPVYSEESETPEWQTRMANGHVQLAKRISEFNKMGIPVIDRSTTRPIKAFAMDHTGYMCQSWPCGAGSDLIAMDLGGNIFPCDTFFQFNEWSYGNIESLSSTPFDDLLEQSPNSRALRERKADNNPSCSNCSTKKSCGGGCPGVTYQKKGTINDADVHCLYLHKFHSELDQLLTDKPTEAIYLLGMSDYYE